MRQANNSLNNFKLNLLLNNRGLSLWCGAVEKKRWGGGGIKGGV